ncbi:MAG: UDP-N-acetylmuramoyl-L-alanine--D-glutamate ligase [Mariprofundaceae bacterium]
MSPKEHITAILGMGATGISLAKFLLSRGIACEGFDEKAIKLPDDLNIPMHKGNFNGKKLKSYQQVLVSPGIRWSHPALEEVRQAHVPVHGDLDIFLQHYQGLLLAVTGTNGKTTTTHMISVMLETLAGGIEAGGNVGIPMLDLIQNDHCPERVVLELSSFQLERGNNIHPNWSVLLNLQPDHADMHTDMDDYRTAKLRIFENQTAGDTAMLPGDSDWDEQAGLLQQRGVRTLRFGHIDENDDAPNLFVCGILHTSNNAKLFWHQHDRMHLIPCDAIPARGMHQHINLAISAQAAADFGVSTTVIHEAVSCFTGLKHRLQHVAVSHGKDWYDDSKATNPDAAAAALHAFDKTLWICGGLRKELDLTLLEETSRNHVTHAYVIGKEPKAYTDMLDKAGVPYTVVGDIQQAVTLAGQHIANHPVLLSPAAASQDQFKNYSERGNAFITAVRALGGQS